MFTHGTCKRSGDRVRRLLPWIVAATWPIAAGADVVQTLDSVDALTSRQVLEMRFGETTVPVPGYEDPVTVSAPIVGTAPGVQTRFAACQRAGDRRLNCLLNSYTDPATRLLTQPVLRYTEAGSVETLFDCTDPALNLDRRRANPCTSMTADLSGSLWLGGRDSQAHRVIKVIEVPTTESCGTDKNPSAGDLTDSRGFSEFLRPSPSGSKFCLRPYATGRPVIVDMLSIDSKAAVGFQGPGGAFGKGVLLLEDRRTAVFVADRKLPSGAPATVAPVEIASGKAGFALIGNEAVQSVALLQKCATGSCPATDLDNYLLATTSGGRVVAKRLDPLGPTAQVFPAPPVTSVSTCGSTAAPQYWVRVSRQTDQIFVSDRSCQQVRAFASASNPLAPLAPLPVGSLSTAPASGTASLDTLSVSPGIGIDLADCFDEDCILVPDGPDTTNQVGARLTSVEIVPNGRSGLTVFRIRGIPDCRYPDRLPTGTCPEGGDKDPVVTINDEAYLDVAKLLPPEVLELFDETTSPTLSELELLIGPQYKSRAPTFEALFGRTEDGVLFRNVFDLEFDVGELLGSGVSRCGFQYAPVTGDPDGWDAIVAVSERHKSAATLDGSIEAVRASSTTTGPARYANMLVNTFCTNPSRTGGKTLTLYAYGLQLTDEAPPDRFALLLSELFDDLERARVLSACRDVDDNGGVAPLSASLCAALATDWSDTRKQLDNCIGAAQAGKTSALDQNCNSFTTQFRQYIQRLEAATPQGLDKANRYGELLVRIAVINYIYADQFIKSVPPGGFQ
jgi:hypothetical protein